MKKLILAAALASVFISPALAQSYNPDVGTGNIAPHYAAPALPGGLGDARSQSPYAAYGAVTPQGFPAAKNNGQSVAAGRAASVKECSILAGQYKETTHGNMDIFQFRACMAQHGQVE